MASPTANKTNTDMAGGASPSYSYCSSSEEEEKSSADSAKVDLNLRETKTGAVNMPSSSSANIHIPSIEDLFGGVASSTSNKHSIVEEMSIIEPLASAGSSAVSQEQPTMSFYEQPYMMKFTGLPTFSDEQLAAMNFDAIPTSSRGDKTGGQTSSNPPRQLFNSISMQMDPSGSERRTRWISYDDFGNEVESSDQDDSDDDSDNHSDNNSNDTVMNQEESFGGTTDSHAEHNCPLDGPENSCYIPKTPMTVSLARQFAEQERALNKNLDPTKKIEELDRMDEEIMEKGRKKATYELFCCSSIKCNDRNSSCNLPEDKRQPIKDFMEVAKLDLKNAITFCLHHTNALSKEQLNAFKQIIKVNVFEGAEEKTTWLFGKSTTPEDGPGVQYLGFKCTEEVEKFETIGKNSFLAFFCRDHKKMYRVGCVDVKWTGGKTATSGDPRIDDALMLPVKQVFDPFMMGGPGLLEPNAKGEAMRAAYKAEGDEYLAKGRAHAGLDMDRFFPKGKDQEMGGMHDMAPLERMGRSSGMGGLMGGGFGGTGRTRSGIPNGIPGDLPSIPSINSSSLVGANLDPNREGGPNDFRSMLDGYEKPTKKFSGPLGNRKDLVDELRNAQGFFEIEEHFRKKQGR